MGKLWSLRIEAKKENEKENCERKTTRLARKLMTMREGHWRGEMSSRNLKNKIKTETCSLCSFIRAVME